MNTTDCERIRMAMMAWLDGEEQELSALQRQHLSTCSSCARWLSELESMTGRLDSLSYSGSSTEFWPAVANEINGADNGVTRHPALWLIAASVLAWRALEMWLDLPLPVLHPVVPIVAMIAAVWMVARDPLAIETSAPELESEASDASA